MSLISAVTGIVMTFSTKALFDGEKVRSFCLSVRIKIPPISFMTVALIIPPEFSGRGNAFGDCGFSRLTILFLVIAKSVLRTKRVATSALFEKILSAFER